MHIEWFYDIFEKCGSLQNLSVMDLSLFVFTDFKDNLFSWEGINGKY
jgi:hypothetical protein